MRVAREACDSRGSLGRCRSGETDSSRQAELSVAIVFSECIGDLSRGGVRVQRAGNGNLARENSN